MSTNSNFKLVSICTVQPDTGLEKTRRKIPVNDGNVLRTLNGLIAESHLIKVAL
jgi:hypothetical protein